MKKHPPTTEHNYQKKVLAYVAEHGVQDVLNLTIQHDPWCNSLRNKVNGFCNCNPEIIPYD